MSYRGQGESVSGFRGRWAVQSQQAGPLCGAGGWGRPLQAAAFTPNPCRPVPPAIGRAATAIAPGSASACRGWASGP